MRRFETKSKSVSVKDRMQLDKLMTTRGSSAGKRELGSCLKVFIVSQFQGVGLQNLRIARNK